MHLFLEGSANMHARVLSESIVTGHLFAFMMRLVFVPERPSFVPLSPWALLHAREQPEIFETCIIS